MGRLPLGNNVGFVASGRVERLDPDVRDVIGGELYGPAAVASATTEATREDEDRNEAQRRAGTP